MQNNQDEDSFKNKKISMGENMSNTEQSKYALAMYDVRGKQEFIFRTNKLQVIVGGSWIIRDIFKDYLFDSAKEVVQNSKGIFNYKDDSISSEKKFTENNFKKHIEEGYIGEVVYEGGGNFLVLFKDMTSFRDVTYKFTKQILEKVGTLKVLATAIEIDSFENYKEDQKKLRKEHTKNEAQESNISPWSCLPIVQVDRKTTQALVEYDYSSEQLKYAGKIKNKGVRGKLSKESIAKLVKYYSEMDRINNKDEEKLTELERVFYKNNEKILDNLVDEKGVNSQLAVIYIDGNSMGAKSQEATYGKKNYEESIEALRKFSEETQTMYVDEGTKHALKDVSNEENSFRIVVSAGDEINFIVKAKDAFSCAENYLNYLKEEDGNNSACAGIAVFHSHSPYSDAYRIAEEACESGKQKMKKANLETAAFIDFHICQGATGTSLDTIREEENGTIISRPWMMWCKEKTSAPLTHYKEVKDLIDYLNNFSRTNIKGLANAAKESKAALQMELDRMFGHSTKKSDVKIKEDYKTIRKKLNDEKDDLVRSIIYDISISYDLWFTAKKENEGDDKNGND